MVLKSGYQIGLLGSLILVLSYTGLNSQNYVLNGSASSVGGDCYQLTPDVGGQAGSFFSQNTIDLTQPFSINATLFFGCKDGNGADGIDFILATSNTALGSGGGGIGYEGITPSIAIEYDDYFNSVYNDPVGDHMAVISMGVLDHSLSTNLAGPIDLTNIEDCMEHCFYVSWDPVSLTLTGTLDENTISYTGDIVTNIFSGNSLVYYGFSSGTGSLSNIHRVCFGPPILEPMDDGSVCEGESIDLEADPNGIGWTWAPDPTLSPLDVSNPTATPNITTSYTTIIEYPCGYFGYDTVVVTVIPFPVITASNNGPVCVGESLSFMANGGVSYEWSGPSGYSSSAQNPNINNINTGMAGLYTVTVTDADGCSATETTLVEVDSGPPINIDPPPLPLCENNGLIQLTASPSGGTWDGDITIDGIFDPGYVGEGIHIVTYTATNGNGCSNTEEIEIEVVPIPVVLIDSIGILCVGSAPIQMTGSPPGGLWTGEITLNGIFDPVTAGEGPHLITYTANDGNGCTNTAEIVVQVDSVMTAVITPQGAFCGQDSITLIANPPGGMWGGATNPDGLILPYSLNEGLHLVTYDLNGSNGCYHSEITIDIQYPEPVLQCPNVPPLCFNDPPVILSATPAGGVWSGISNEQGLVDPSSLSPGLHMAVYTDTTTVCTFVNSCWSYVEIFDAPTISNVNTTCDSMGSSYVVTFIISGGDSSTYSVNGSVAGTLIPGSPYYFTSEPLVSGDAFSFIIDDINHCEPVLISGGDSCTCPTNSGSMDLNLISVCHYDTVFVLPPIGSVLDPNDTLIYVLHTGNPDSILMTGNPTNAFVFNPPLQLETIYYVSAMVGNTLHGTGIDTLDPCLSVSAGTPVIWRARPEVTMTGPAEICANDSALITFHLSSAGPFDFLITADGLEFDTLTNIDSGFTLMIHPLSNTMYLVIDLIDQNGCKLFLANTYSIQVVDSIRTQQTLSICSGDSVFLESEFQTLPGIYTDTFLAASGCDSVVISTLLFHPQDTTRFQDTSCDSALTGVFLHVFTDQNGCDSTIIITTTYAEADTTQIQSFTCDQQDSGIFTNWFISQDGCDSLVIETIDFVPADTTLLSGETCNTAEAGMFITIHSNTGGCDSFVIETIQFIPADTTLLSGETCNASAAGMFTQSLLNAKGCDSLVIENISLLPTDTLFDYTLTCLSQDTGTQIQIYTNVHGCDSVLWMITALAPEDSCQVITKDVFIPNLFSPNGDGQNDLFLIFSNPDAVSNISYFRIFDRWGGLVFEELDIVPNEPEYGWDGTEKGQPLNPGVYVWTVLIEFTDGKTEIFSGDVTLIR